MFRKAIPVCCDSSSKRLNTPCGQNEESLKALKSVLRVVSTVKGETT